MGGQAAALSDAAATDLVVGFGAGGSFVLVVALIWLASRRTVRHARQQDKQRQTAAVGARRDGYPQQPYSPDEPGSHRPYSKPYKIPRQDAGSGVTRANGSHPGGATGVPMGPWPGGEDED